MAAQRTGRPRISVVGASEMSLVVDDLERQLRAQGYTEANGFDLEVLDRTVVGATVDEYHNHSYVTDPLLGAVTASTVPITDEEIRTSDITVLCLGGNDLLLGRTPDDVKDLENRLTAFIDRCHRLGGRVALVGFQGEDMRPLIESVGLSPDYIRAIEQMYQRLSEREGVVAFYPSLYEGLGRSDFLATADNPAGRTVCELVEDNTDFSLGLDEYVLGTIDWFNGREGVHPNHSGQEKIARGIATFLEPVLQTLMQPEEAGPAAAATPTQPVMRYPRVEIGP